MTTATKQRAARGASVKGSMPQIEHSDGPVGKGRQQDQPESVDDRAQGHNLAIEVIAAQKAANRGPWPMFAQRLIGMTREAREQFLKSLSEWLKETRAAERGANAKTLDDQGNPEATSAEKREAAAVVSSATTNVSMLQTIGKAWNQTPNGANKEDAVLYYLSQRPRLDPAKVVFADVGYVHLYRYCAGILKSTAGRTRDPWPLKVQKFLERNAPGGDAPDEWEATRKAMLVACADMIKAMPAAKRILDPLSVAEMTGIV